MSKKNYVTKTRQLAAVKPLTNNQLGLFQAYEDGYHIVARGSAGTGKTFVAIYLALRDILSGRSEQERVILVRSAVPTRDLGFLPGTLEEKTLVYEYPYIDMIESMGMSYDELLKTEKLVFITTSFLRGITWDRSVIILDEAQNATFHEINSVVTRLGEQSRIMVLGDTRQRDLQHEVSGFHTLLRVVRHMQEFATVEFTPEDVVRSTFVKSWLYACEEEHV